MAQERMRLLLALLVAAASVGPAVQSASVETAQHDVSYLRPPSPLCEPWTDCATAREQALLLLAEEPSDRTPGGDFDKNGQNGFPETPKHKNLFPLSWMDLLGYAIAVVTIFIAAGGGIGGGGVLVPLYVVCWGFQTEHAVALSNLTIAGGAFANLMCNVSRRHPAADRPLIDWDLILVMEPMTIVGAVLGGFLTKLLPTWLTTVLLFALLVFMSYKLWARARRAAAAEATPESSLAHLDVEEQAALSDDGDGCEALEPLVSAEWGSKNKTLVDALLMDAEPAAANPRAPEAKAMLEKDRRSVPPGNVATLTALFAWLLVTGMLKDVVACGSLAYWALTLSMVPLVAAVMAVVRRRLIGKQRLKVDVGLVPEAGDIGWTERTTITYPAACSCAGVVAGMFGVGGGIIKGPLMLHLGVLPEVAAATSATMILFTAGSASVVYLTFGGVKWDYAALMIVTGFLVTTAGQLLTYQVIAKLGRRSIIVVAMAVLLSSGAVIMGYEAVAAVARAYPDHYLEHDTICSDDHRI